MRGPIAFFPRGKGIVDISDQEIGSNDFYVIDYFLFVKSVFASHAVKGSL